MIQITKLKALEIGDRFCPVKDGRAKFQVTGNPTFNLRHGRPTRMCFNLLTKEYVSKSCGIDVIKF